MLIERMIGAGVIVILLVLIAPALLDGRRDRESVTETVPLPEPELRTETIYLNGSQREAAAEESPPEPAAVAKVPAPVSAPEPTESLPQAAAPVAPPPKAEPKPAPVVEQSAASTLEGFAVQLGSFSSRDNADRFVGELRGEGRFLHEAKLGGDVVKIALRKVKTE